MNVEARKGGPEFVDGRVTRQAEKPKSNGSAFAELVAVRGLGDLEANEVSMSRLRYADLPCSVQRQGLLGYFGGAPERFTEAELKTLFVTSDTCYSRLKTMEHALRISEMLCRWALPASKLHGDRAEWSPLQR
jgi:hypothetical protein